MHSWCNSKWHLHKRCLGALSPAIRRDTLMDGRAWDPQHKGWGTNRQLGSCLFDSPARIDTNLHICIARQTCRKCILVPVHASLLWPNTTLWHAHAPAHPYIPSPWCDMPPPLPFPIQLTCTGTRVNLLQVWIAITTYCKCVLWSTLTASLFCSSHLLRVCTAITHSLHVWIAMQNKLFLITDTRLFSKYHQVLNKWTQNMAKFQAR